MPAVPATEIRDELVRFLSDQVLDRSVPLDEQVVLAEAGVDSFSLMEVVLFVERRWGVDMPMDRLTPDNVHTLASLARCVTEVVHAAP